MYVCVWEVCVWGKGGSVKVYGCLNTPQTAE